MVFAEVTEHRQVVDVDVDVVVSLFPPGWRLGPLFGNSESQLDEGNAVTLSGRLLRIDGMLSDRSVRLRQSSGAAKCRICAGNHHEIRSREVVAQGRNWISNHGRILSLEADSGKNFSTDPTCGQRSTELTEIAQCWIEDVSKPVADQAHRQNGQHQRDSGQDTDPPGTEKIVAAAIDH